MNKLSFYTACLLVLFMMGCGGNPSDSGDDEDDLGDDVTAPVPPSNLAGESGDTLVELAWSANSEDDLDGYRVYRSENSFSDVSGMDPVSGSTPLTGTTYTDEGLQNGTPYYYRITAVDESGNESNPSAQVEVTPFSDPPDRP